MSFFKLGCSPFLFFSFDAADEKFASPHRIPWVGRSFLTYEPFLSQHWMWCTVDCCFEVENSWKRTLEIMEKQKRKSTRPKRTKTIQDTQGMDLNKVLIRFTCSLMDGGLIAVKINLHSPNSDLPRFWSWWPLQENSDGRKDDISWKIAWIWSIAATGWS